jgi:hypothetical protein
MAGRTGIARAAQLGTLHVWGGLTGPFLHETGPGRDVAYASAWVTYKF